MAVVLESEVSKVHYFQQKNSTSIVSMPQQPLVSTECSCRSFASIFALSDGLQGSLCFLCFGCSATRQIMPSLLRVLLDSSSKSQYISLNEQTLQPEEGAQHSPGLEMYCSSCRFVLVNRARVKGIFFIPRNKR
jgi:hypothetical protein